MSLPKEQKKISVELEGRDQVDVEIDGPAAQVHVRGCTEMLGLMHKLRKNFGANLKQWPLPKGATHSEILLRELILKLRGEWNYPYKEDEVCHCRSVSTHTIDQAIIAGAHTTDMVSRQTSASTACGTCRLDVQRMIQYRLTEGFSSTQD